MYTYAKDSLERRSGQTAMLEVLQNLLKIIAPLLAITTDEVWGYLSIKDKSESVHLESWPDEKEHDKWSDKDLQATWTRLVATREEVLKKLEEKRQGGIIGSSLEAAVTLVTNDAALKKILQEKKDFLKYLFIVSQVKLKEGEPAILIEKAKGNKCSRCWNYGEAVGAYKDHPSLCERCVQNIK